ncbi:hypothetical protein [Clostridium psychrophilum]|uniref:hypothetical protein n=1 Tax=Clostridium psychrophilum TaxID=132926 RepID=UPI001C0D1B33|nr:hypothetical protein [Clostridium psychrophilum]MBU3182480.1 hypothetical protein [Clostridium psychrophilum]
MKKIFKLALCGILLFSIGFGVTIYGRKLINNKSISESKAKQTTVQKKVAQKITEISNAAAKKRDETKAQQTIVQKNVHSNVKTSAFDYDTGITYDQLASLPDQFIGCGVHIDNGDVLEISRAGKMLTLKLAIDSDIIDKYLLVVCKSSVAPSNISDGDGINIKGISKGHANYTDTSSGSILSLPEISADKIIENK